MNDINYTKVLDDFNNSIYKNYYLSVSSNIRVTWIDYKGKQQYATLAKSKYNHISIYHSSVYTDEFPYNKFLDVISISNNKYFIFKKVMLRPINICNHYYLELLNIDKSYINVDNKIYIVNLIYCNNDIHIESNIEMNCFIGYYYPSGSLFDGQYKGNLYKFRKLSCKHIELKYIFP